MGSVDHLNRVKTWHNELLLRGYSVAAAVHIFTLKHRRNSFGSTTAAGCSMTAPFHVTNRFFTFRFGSYVLTVLSS